MRIDYDPQALRREIDAELLILAARATEGLLEQERQHGLRWLCTLAYLEGVADGRAYAFLKKGGIGMKATKRTTTNPYATNKGGKIESPKNTSKDQPVATRIVGKGDLRSKKG